jgi:predicted GNAT family acetyltransferase
MVTITAYQTPQQFLDATAKVLEQKELVNNLTLGIPNGFADKTKQYPGCVFINAFEDGQLQATSIKTISKALVSGFTQNTDALRALASYYLDHNIDLSGAVGEGFYSTMFAEFYGKPQVRTRTMIVHELKVVNPLPLAPGTLEIADAEDIELITQWTLNFEEDAKTFPKQSAEQVLKSTQARIASGSIFKWIDREEVVSIAAIVRRTKNMGIVGLVYTPDKLRGKGYATGTVQKLSEYILQNGFSGCGLFTDKSNPTSNHIYKKIGYSPLTEFADIEFE